MTFAAAILWGHACAALLFARLALARGRDSGSRLPRASFVVAATLTALWALAAAGIDSRDVVTRVIESARNIAWFAFLYALLGRPGWAARASFAALTLLCVATAAVAVLEAMLGAGEFAAARLAMRLVAAGAGLGLTLRLLGAAPAGQGGLRLALLALAGMWGVELGGFAAALAAGGWPTPLVVARGLAMIGVAAALTVALQRGGDWTLRLSRGLAFRAVAVAAVAAYAVVVALAIRVLGDQARPVQAAFVTGATALLLGAFASSWLRGWLRVKIAKHLFDHRYDYRAEWLRFTATLGRPGAPAPRIARAMADLTGSPAALLLSAEDEGLAPLGGWNWQGAEGATDGAFAAVLDGDRILDLDALRAERAERAALPDWLAGERAAWALVPLLHLDRLVGAVVLARPPVARTLDWEDFDLLRTAGRQAASYLAEDRAAAALGEARRFDEFNRRFAFIVHDVKNLVSQLNLTARNAERHADNPAFRADMIATLQDSCGRLSGLLARLSHQAPTAARLRPTDLAASAARVAAGRAGQVTVTGAGVALADPARLEQALGHLVQNAVEASPPGAAVALAVADTGAHITLTVTDSGAGMDAGFVRDELFRPFASSKPTGFGIGAFEARQLVRAMHGTLAVASRPGRGTVFTLAFPAAPALEEAA